MIFIYIFSISKYAWAEFDFASDLDLDALIKGTVSEKDKRMQKEQEEEQTSEFNDFNVQFDSFGQKGIKANVDKSCLSESFPVVFKLAEDVGLILSKTTKEVESI